MCGTGQIGREAVRRAQGEMTGIVFNLLEGVVTRYHGESAWDGLLDATGLEGAYTSLGNYPDEQLQELVEAAAGRFGMSPEDVLHWFGREAAPLLAQRYPEYFEAHRSTRPLLLGLNRMPHPGLTGLTAEAGQPAITFQETPDGGVAMEARSPQRLCQLAQGLIEGAANHYGERVAFEHRTCTQRGDAQCLCQMKFTRTRSH